MTALDLSLARVDGRQLVIGSFNGKRVVNVFVRNGHLMPALAILRQRNLGRILRDRMLETDGACESCSKVKPLHLHHKKHRGHGGNDHPDNLIALCGGGGSCHDAAHGL